MRRCDSLKEIVDGSEIVRDRGVINRCRLGSWSSRRTATRNDEKASGEKPQMNSDEHRSDQILLDEIVPAALCFEDQLDHFPDRAVATGRIRHKVRVFASLRCRIGHSDSQT